MIVVGDLSSYSHPRDRHLIYIDSALSAMQLILAAQTIKVESCIINWPDLNLPERKINKAINLKPFERPTMLIALGYPDKNIYIPFSDKKNSRSSTKIIS